jgi:hypothetical protein
MPKNMKTHKLHKDETMALYIHKMISLRWQGQKLVLSPALSSLQNLYNKHRQKEGEGEHNCQT